MDYKAPNYNSWLLLPLTNIKNINTLYINNVFVGKEKIEKFLYILINNDGSAECLEYINTLKQEKNFIKNEIIDYDLILFKFKINYNDENYSHLINAKYNLVSSDYSLLLAESLISNCKKLYNEILSFYKILIYIVKNSEQLFIDYYEYKLKIVDVNFINQIKSTGIYFSNFNDNNFFNEYLKMSNKTINESKL
ncbi:MAG TPA: hypothetical protein PKD00_00210 [Burkholderiales bacterium]|nr:hypothetical protein [Burkholderiales bacterium]